ncbi:hypothetical protein Tco_0064177 [Tanacetum coccineum]
MSAARALSVRDGDSQEARCRIKRRVFSTLESCGMHVSVLQVRVAAVCREWYTHPGVVTGISFPSSQADRHTKGEAVRATLVGGSVVSLARQMREILYIMGQSRLFMGLLARLRGGSDALRLRVEHATGQHSVVHREFCRIQRNSDDEPDSGRSPFSRRGGSSRLAGLGGAGYHDGRDFYLATGGLTVPLILVSNDIHRFAICEAHMGEQQMASGR